MTLTEAMTHLYPEALTGRCPHAVPGTRRETLPALLRAVGATRGAEIGVEQGVYSEMLCQQVPGLELLCVDAWQAYPGYREHVSQAKLDGFHTATVARLAPYRCTVLRSWSVDAARVVPDGTLDFVYLDGNHTLPQVVADLAAWVPKVRPGGVVAGHDYRRDEKRGGLFHVRQAVQAWTSAYRISPWYLLAGEPSATWLWAA